MQQAMIHSAKRRKRDCANAAPFLYTPTYIYIAEWYAIALMVYQFGSLFTGNPNVFGLIAAFAVLAVIVYMMFIKRCSEANKPAKSVKVSNKRL